MTEENAMELAKAYAADCGWPWVEPVVCRRRAGSFLAGPHFTLRTNADKRGANVVITVDEATGAVTGHLLPR